MTSYERLIEALQNAGCHVQQTGERASAQAPGHSPADRSLSILYNPAEGRTAFMSFADDKETVLDTIGLSLADLFDNPSGSRYDYGDGRQVFRSPDKKFRQSGNTKGTQLFHADRIPSADTVYVVEGEHDVLTLEAQGVTATCTAMGAGKAHLFDLTPLHGKRVVIVQDMDTPGAAHAKQVAELVAPHADVTLVAPKVGKDATDHITAGHSVDEFTPLDTASDGAEPDEHGPPDLLANVIDGRTLDQQVFPPLEWVVQNIIPQGFGLLVAPPKAGKSWLVAGVGLACASGGRALGHIVVARRPVLYLALEDGHRRLQHRYRQLLQGQPIPEQMYSLTGFGLHSVTDVMTAFLEKHDGEKPIIILDTLGKVKPPKKMNQDSYTADYAIGSALKATIDAHPGATLLAVHHTRKMESADFVDAVSGTQGIAGSADFVLVLARKRQSDEATLSITGRDVEESEVALVTQGGAWSLSSPSFAKSAEDAVARREKSNKSDRTIRALEFVKSRPTTTPLELSAYLDISSNDAGTYLRRMYTDGLIDKSGRGVFCPPQTVSEVSFVSEPDDQSDTSDGDLQEPELPLTSQKDTTDTKDTDYPMPLCKFCGKPCKRGTGAHVDCIPSVTKESA